MDLFDRFARWCHSLFHFTLPPHTFAVVLAAKDEMTLAEAELLLKEKGIEHVAIREPDEPWNGQLMAIGIVPAPKSDLKKILQKYPLLKQCIPTET